MLQTNINNHNKKIKYDNLTDDLTYIDINSNSWFDISKAKYKTCAKFTYNKTDEKSDKIIKCKQIKLLPTDEQKKKLLLWLEYIKLKNKN